MRGIGWRGLDTRDLYFDDVWVPDTNLIGDPALGLRQFLGTLEVGADHRQVARAQARLGTVAVAPSTMTASDGAS